MFNEEIKPGEGTPAPASGESQPEDPKPEETPQEGQPTGEGNADQSAELEALKNQVSELQGLTEKQKTQIEQAGFNIQKYKDKLKEAGIEFDEDGRVSQEQIQEIVGQATKPLIDQINQMGTTLSEIARASKAVPSANAGGAGQRVPPKPKEPELPSAIKDQIARLNLKWTGQGKVYKSELTGKTYDYEETTGNADHD